MATTPTINRIQIAGQRWQTRAVWSLNNGEVGDPVGMDGLTAITAIMRFTSPTGNVSLEGSNDKQNWLSIPQLANIATSQIIARQQIELFWVRANATNLTAGSVVVDAIIGGPQS